MPMYVKLESKLFKLGWETTAPAKPRAGGFSLKMNRMQAMIFENTGGPLRLKVRVTRKWPVFQKCYLWACITFGSWRREVE